MDLVSIRKQIHVFLCRHRINLFSAQQLQCIIRARKKQAGVIYDSAADCKINAVLL